MHLVGLHGRGTCPLPSSTIAIFGFLASFCSFSTKLLGFSVGFLALFLALFISYDRLSCGSTNVIYGIHCVHCGLVYVGETGRSLRSRMNGHRSAIKKGGQSLLHRHFHQPDHSVDDMRVQILEKVYHSSENPTLLTSLRRTRELFWIKELGTAKPYGFNDQIKGVGTLSSISCKKTNIYSLFNKQPRRKRSHGKGTTIKELLSQMLLRALL